MDPRLSTPADSLRTVSVLLPQALDRSYDYRVPSGMDVVPGSFVEVPLRGQRRVGVVWGPGEGLIETEKLREIKRLLDLPVLPAASREFVDWVARYTLAPVGNVLRMAMSVADAFEPARTRTGFVRAPGIDLQTESLPGGLKWTRARRDVIRELDGPALTAADLARKASVTMSVIRRLAAADVLREVAVTEPEMAPAPGKPIGVLSPAQKRAAEELTGKLEQDRFSVTLLDGVTGSGKTEVYFETISAAITTNRQVAVLLPEITLTEDWLARFEKRFGAPATVWHSGLPMSVRRRTWRAVLGGSAKLVVGARSALLLPYRNLGLIIVDEEHDSSFKQEDGVIYNARDMAVVRGRIGGFPVILSTATPSLDTIDNVWRGRYGHVSLPRRHASAKLPEISAIDMRLEQLEPGRWLSPTLCAAIRDTLLAQEQVVLFLNRRGYAPLTLCRACGYRMACPHCTAWLVEHRSQGKLRCHYCGYHMPIPRICPACEAEDRFSTCGPGVERIAVETSERFPGARLEIMSSDTVDGPGAAADLVARMRDRSIDILIGTQILAKGFHFPWLTLVGVIDSDLGLSGGDLRAAERTYQLLHQVSGRAGRGDRPGRAFLQTYQPSHPVISALVAGDRDRFLEAEAVSRQQFEMPPYGRLAAVIVSGPDEEEVDRTAARLGRTAPRQDGIDVLGPVPAPFAVIRNRHRRRLLLRARKGMNVQVVIRRWISPIRTRGGTRIVVDIDPYSFQ